MNGKQRSAEVTGTLQMTIVGAGKDGWPLLDERVPDTLRVIVNLVGSAVRFEVLS